MQKIDLKKTYAKLYKAAAKKSELVAAPTLNYLMCDGYGNPNNSVQFQDAVSALYTLSYTLKFMIKKGTQQIDYGVMPLEGLWWTDNMSNFSTLDKAAWKWTLMILQPDFITADLFEAARKIALKKKKTPMLEDIRSEQMTEGECAQILHLGPYSTEGPTVERLHVFIKDSGYELTGKHREIYLNDMRRTAPEKLKTIIRQPVIK